jgi:hypothetical protein
MPLRRQGKRQTSNYSTGMRGRGQLSANDTEGHVVGIVGTRGGRRRDLGAAAWPAMEKASTQTRRRSYYEKKQTNKQANGGLDPNPSRPNSTLLY